MAHFYIHRPHGQARALARAQRRLIADGYDPFHWAAFVFAGR